MTISNNLQGKSLIDGEWIEGVTGVTHGLNPATNAELEPSYSLINKDQLQEATSAAAEAFPIYRALEPEKRAAFLDAIAEEIDNLRADIVDRATQETGLPSVRIDGETTRTVNQLRLFATVVRSGSFHRVRIDPAQPERTPAPRLDIRQRMVPVGPVAVFGASNFPLAFSTAGGDTASALAAGCPVVFKAHNAHPGTSELVGQAIAAAIKSSGVPAGVFSLIYGAGTEIGQALVADPRIKAVGFTGSRGGGMAIAKTAFEREVPIPVYAEMSAVNPVFIYPGALKEPEKLASAFAASVTGSCGQLCTEPGLVFLPFREAGDIFLNAAKQEIESATGGTMLTPGIADARNTGVEALSSETGVSVFAEGNSGDGENAPAPILLNTTIQHFLENKEMQREIFGAESLIIRYDQSDELLKAAEVLEGQLTATVHADSEDKDDVAKILPSLELIAGRILFNGWPTGVEVGHAMVHGGPFPATSDSRTTSVGTLAIERFLRPVAYQEVPVELQPEPIRDANPWNVPQSIDGK